MQLDGDLARDMLIDAGVQFQQTVDADVTGKKDLRLLLGRGARLRKRPQNQRSGGEDAAFQEDAAGKMLCHGGVPPSSCVKRICEKYTGAF